MQHALASFSPQSSLRALWTTVEVAPLGAGFQCRPSKHDGRRPGMACRTHGVTNTPRTRFRAPRD
jgi:hypothetical protein